MVRDGVKQKSYGMLPVLLLAGVVFCACCAGAMTAALMAEEYRPYELKAIVKEGAVIQNSDIAALYQIEGVEAVTPVCPAAVTLRCGDLEVGLIVYGIRGHYIDKTSIRGSTFAEKAGVPQLVLNQAAIELLEDGAKENSIETGDWLNARYSIYVEGTDRKFRAVVCGFLEDGSEKSEAAALISLDALTGLLKAGSMDATAGEVMIRCQNIGYAKKVSNSLDTKILTATAVEEELSVRSKSIRQNLVYLIIVAAICLVCALALMRSRERSGLPAGTHRLPVAILANILGLLAALLLPYLFPPEQRAEALFALPVPPWALLAGITLPFLLLLKSP